MTEKAPFLVTLVLTIIGWAITHVATELTEAPTLEFESTMKSGAQSSIFTLHLINLTRSSVFRNLTLLVTVPEGEVLKSFAITPEQPANEGDDPSRTVGRSGNFTFPEIQPGESLYADVEYTGNEPPYVRISLPTGVIRLVRPSLETFVIKNEVLLLVLLAAFGIATLLFMAVANSRTNRHTGRVANYID